jgi:DNA polymerase III subunit gamma/tau
MNGQTDPTPYRVLARKYRPINFDGLIGQEALVRTLTNSINSGRLAHAFILTGVRGVGKTSTARIIARALNCTGPDDNGGPTPNPCGECENCRAIADDRHVDVLEMDAASRTGVDDVRELIDGVLYRPVSARYKVYIIDEVHMLSKNAFNALLKTLEEPPEHVKFIFATTEIRKVPVTVLSRCQRFDLRRVDADTLVAHFARIAGLENAQITQEALMLIARAADGSVRDGLSLLDQAIAHSGAGGVDEDQLRAMLGLVDRVQVFDLFDVLMKGDIGAALDIADTMYDAGADPVVMLQDLLELSHWLTRLKIVPESGDSAAVSDVERRRGRDMAERLAMPALTRAWQMLLKGLGEARVAPSAQQAAEMVLVRLAYAAELPTPAEMVKKLQSDESGPGGEPDRKPPEPPMEPPVEQMAPAPIEQAAPTPEATPAPPEPTVPAAPETFEQAVELCATHGEMVLYAHLMNDVALVRFAPGRVELTAGPRAPDNLAAQFGRLLSDWTGASWQVEIHHDAPAEPSLGAQRDVAERAHRDKAIAHPSVQAALDAFPGAKVEDVRSVPAMPMFDADLANPDNDPMNGEPTP